jgi:hypothetical protein
MLLQGIEIVDDKPEVKRIISRKKVVEKILKYEHPYYEYLKNGFSGFLPQKTRERIRGAKYIFGKDRYLIGEANEWFNYLIGNKGFSPSEELYSGEVYTPKSSGLIAIGILNDKAYLIDQFNTTSIEQYLADTFATRREGE